MNTAARIDAPPHDTGACATKSRHPNPVREAEPHKPFAAAGRALLLCAQIALLWLVSWLGHEAVDLLKLPLPGSVVGLLLMFALLHAGIVPLSFVEQGAGLLLRHLALFFIPIAVGMMSFWALWQSSGLAILADLLISAAVGFAVTGLLCQALPRRQPADLFHAVPKIVEVEHESA
jgi:holin-like protein